MCDEARQALAAASNFIQKARSLNDTGTCTIGTISMPVILNLPGVLSELRKRHQDVKLTIYQNISGHIIEAVASGEMDAGFVIGDINEKCLGVMPVSPITLCIVGPWAWRDKIQAAEWEDIPKFPWISTPEKCSFSTISQRFFECHNVTLTPSIVADQEKTLTEMVCLDMGLTLMREDIALTAQESEKLFIWPKAKTVSQLCFIWARSRESSQVVNALIDSVKALWKQTA
ncbi:LysR family transcriptional regulator substrate-binding protein [Vagococcus sp. WN89Y]|uniref:LysR family transcriptional regulator substrate-binding protein n=1 Tax=Vagococcus sp. WN89Y TaxID=3457258 RepID=UPI003FCE9174